MISQHDIKEALKRSDIIGYNEETDEVYSKRSNEVLFNLEGYTEYMRKRLHCSFEELYYDSCDLTSILKCTECSTVIFSSDDYQEYDAKLKCPTCSGYKTHFDFWTKEDIEADSNKQYTLDFYNRMNERSDRIYKREEKTGLRNSELWKIEREKGLDKIEYILKVFDYDSNKIRGLHFEKKVWTMEPPDSLTRTLNNKRGYKIPLGWTYIYVMYIYTHLRKAGIVKV